MRPGNLSIRQTCRMAAMVLPTVLVILTGIIMACSSDECYENKNSLPLAGFYSSGETPKAISLGKVSIYGIGAPGDSILHNATSGLKESYLPFRIDRGETSYVIEYLEGVNEVSSLADTVRFNYEIEPWFVSASCGAIYRYRMKDIYTTHHIIDSVTCPTGIIDNVAIENIRIYFRVTEE